VFHGSVQGLQELAKVSDGDLRRAITTLQVGVANPLVGYAFNLLPCICEVVQYSAPGRQV